MNAPAKLAEPMIEAAHPVPHVLTAINGVMAEIAQEGIAKARNNSQQNYKFRGIDDVYNALAPLLAKHKLIITPKGLGRTCEERQSKSGGTLFYVNVEVEYELCSALDATTKVAGPFYGEAMDSADKATNKAQSAAYKYMAMQEFCIPTEGDNDADGQTHEVAPRGQSRSHSGAAELAIRLLCDCTTSAEFKEVWEKNKDGWKQMLDPADAQRVWAVKDDMVAKFSRQAAAPKEGPTAAELIGEDEIPY